MGRQIVQTDKSFRVLDDSAGTIGSQGQTLTKPLTHLSLDEGNRAVTSIINTVARTDTTTKVLGVLPKAAVPTRLSLASATASNAGTTATVSVGTAATSNYFLNGFDVKGSTGSQQVFPTSATKLHAAVDSANDTVIVGLYAETGATSSGGGPWGVQMDYYLP